MAQVLPTFYESFARGQRDALDFQTAVEEEKRRKAAEQRLQQMFPLEMQGKEYNNQYMREIGRNVGYKNEYEGQTLQQRIAAEIAAQQAAAAKSGIEKGYYTDSQELIRLAGEEAAAAGGNAASARALQGLPGMFPQQMFEYTQNPRVTARTTDGAAGTAGFPAAPGMPGYMAEPATPPQEYDWQADVPSYLRNGFGSSAPAAASTPAAAPAAASVPAASAPAASAPADTRSFAERYFPNSLAAIRAGERPVSGESFGGELGRYAGGAAGYLGVIPETLASASIDVGSAVSRFADKLDTGRPDLALMSSVGDAAKGFYNTLTGQTPKPRSDKPIQYGTEVPVLPRDNNTPLYAPGDSAPESLYGIDERLSGQPYAPPAEPPSPNLQRLAYDALIQRGLDPKLVEAMLTKDAQLNLYPGTTAAIAFQESSFDPTRVNPDSGAAGLMQIMPQNWEPYGGKNFKYDDPYQSLDVYEKLMRERIKRHGIENLDSILRAYNGRMDLSSTSEENLEFPGKIRERFEQLYGFALGSR